MSHPNPPLEPTKSIFDSLSADNRHQRSIAHDLCAIFNRSPSKGSLNKIKRLFNQCGDKVLIESGFHCDYGKYISLGSNIFINFNCTMLDGGKIQIGNDTLIGPNVQILTINHPLSPKERLNKTSIASDIIIGENVWIGAGVIILPGSCIGNGAVIGAGSTVNGAVSANSLYIGSPARKVRDLT